MLQVVGVGLLLLVVLGVIVFVALWRVEHGLEGDVDGNEEVTEDDDEA